MVTIPIKSLIDILNKDDLKIDQEDDCLDFLIDYIQFRLVLQPLNKIEETKDANKK